MKENLTHFDKEGQAIMVDVSDKANTHRTAVACGFIKMNEAAFNAVESGNSKKGDVLALARVAGIMASKSCPSLIPLCHTVPIESVSVSFALHRSACEIEAQCTVSCTGKTGVEMEALCGVNIALLTIYDMCKAADRGMTIHTVRLLKKQGGKSGHYRRGNCNDV